MFYNMSDEIPEVSVIIISYNGENLLRDTLETLQKFTTGVSYEAVIVDNNSTKINIKQIASGYKNVNLIINKENLGYAAANNIGAKAARGKYICLVNNDMIFIEDVITKCINYIKENNERVFVSPKILNHDGSHQISISKFDTLKYIFATNFFLYLLFPRSKTFNKYYYNHFDYTEPTEVDLIRGCFMVMGKKEFSALGGFHEDSFFYGEETELCYRFWQSGGKVVYYPLTKVIHLGGGVSKDTPWFVYKHQALAKVRTYRKFLSKPQFILALFFHYCGLLLRIPVYMGAGLFKFDKSFFKKAYFYFKQIFVYPKS